MESSFQELTATIEKNGNNPEDWLAFIHTVKHHSTSYDHLMRLYGKASSLISPDENRKNLSYARLMVEFAKLQSISSPDDARDIFRIARCNVKKFAIVYLAWAQFELSQGNRGKCKNILNKGKVYAAEPVELLNLALHSCEQGNERLLDDETEDLAFTGILSEPGKPREKLEIPTLQSDSELTQEKMMAGIDSSTGNQVQNIQGQECGESLSLFPEQGIESSTGNQVRNIQGQECGESLSLFPEQGIDSSTGNQVQNIQGQECGESLSLFPEQGIESSTGNQVPNIQSHECGESLSLFTKQDNSGVISFKLSETSLLSYPRIRQKLSSSSSSGEETITAPLHHICRPSIRSLSTCKPSIKATPDCKSVDSSSLSNSMNLSVRKSARRGFKNNSLFLGPPMRGKHVSSLEDVKEKILEGEEQKEDDNMNDFKTLDYTSSVPIHDKVLSENNKDPGLSIMNNENNPAQVNLEANNPAGIRSTILTLHENVARSALHTEGHENYSLMDSDSHMDQDPPRNIPDQNKVSQLHLHQDNGRPEHIYSQERSTNRCHSKQAVHPNLRYPNQEAASYQGYHNEFASNIKKMPINQIVPQGLSAIDNSTIIVNGKQYLKLGTIGRGGSSKVFRAFDGQRVCAVKYVSLEDADDVIIQSYINEISMLKRLQGSDHIIKLYDWEQKKCENSIVLVLECGSIDLAAFLRKHRSSFRYADLVACWEGMLEAVDVIHRQGIIHSDLKPANFLFVEGTLKLIDFGIAISIQADQTSIHRDTQVGTLNFMSPEAFKDISGSSQLVNPATGRSRPCTKIGRPSDVWSLGCILYNMVYGRTPFQHITNQAMKLQCIMDENYAIEFPPVENPKLLDVLKGCLIRNPRKRYTIPQLLKHPLLSLQKQDPDEEQLFNCLLQFAQAQVNSPRSIRVASKSICEQLRSGNKIDLSSVLAKKQHLQQSIPLRKPLEGLNVQELLQSHGSMETPASSFAAANMGSATLYSNKVISTGSFEQMERSGNSASVRKNYCLSKSYGV